MSQPVASKTVSAPPQAAVAKPTAVQPETAPTEVAANVPATGEQAALQGYAEDLGGAQPSIVLVDSAVDSDTGTQKATEVGSSTNVVVGG
jgi:hypothetical protein